MVRRFEISGKERLQRGGKLNAINQSDSWSSIARKNLEKNHSIVLAVVRLPTMTQELLMHGIMVLQNSTANHATHNG